MHNRLTLRLAGIIIGITAGILILFMVMNLITTHHHIQMYEQQTKGSFEFAPLHDHLEQALNQSILVTGLFSILLAIFIGIYFAKRVSTPLVTMKQIAERMTKGHYQVKIPIRGQDEIADLGASLNELAVQLERQEKVRMAMTQDIAHELRTPLTTLKSHMRALEDGIWEPTSARFRACLEETDRLINLVAELEELHQMESETFQLNRRNEDIYEVIQRAIELMSPIYYEKKVTLVPPSPGRLLLSLDPDRFLQILLNLLTNALHHTPADGQVDMIVETRKKTVVITIQDTGQGIHPDDLPYIFERLYRGDKSRTRAKGGNGMGLAITNRLVQAHGGKIYARNGQDGGSIFDIELPLM